MNCRTLVLFPWLVLLVVPGALPAQEVYPGTGHTYFRTDLTVWYDVALLQASVVGGYLVSLHDEAEEEWVATHRTEHRA